MTCKTYKKTIKQLWYFKTTSASPPFIHNYFTADFFNVYGLFNPYHRVAREQGIVLVQRRIRTTVKEKECFMFVVHRT